MKTKPVDGEKAMFIRSHPDMTAPEIVKLASEHGIAMQLGYVHTLRSADRAKERRLAAQAEPDLEGLSTRPPDTASEFVRRYPIGAPAVEVVEKGLAAGFPSINKGIVHQVRSVMRKAMAAHPKKAKPKPAHGSKADFVRGFPADTPTDEVLKAAEVKGIKLTAGYISNVHRRDAGTKQRAPAKKKAGPTPTKAEFILSFQAGSDAKAIVAASKDRGISVTERHVRGVLANARKGRHLNGSAKPSPPAKAAKVAAKPEGWLEDKTVDQQAVALLRALGAELGLARAISILEDEREHVRSVLDRLSV